MVLLSITDLLHYVFLFLICMLNISFGTTNLIFYNVDQCFQPFFLFAAILKSYTNVCRHPYSHFMPLEFGTTAVVFYKTIYSTTYSILCTQEKSCFLIEKCFKNSEFLFLWLKHISQGTVSILGSFSLPSVIICGEMMIFFSQQEHCQQIKSKFVSLS